MASARHSRELKSSIETVGRSPDGRTVIGYILSMCGHGTSAFASDDRTTLYELGRRSAALDIVAALREAGISDLECEREYAEVMRRSAEERKARKEAESKERED